MYYPLRFYPVYKDYIWGGRRLAELGKILPENGRVAESWEISAHPNGISVISNGPLAGISLTDACEKLGSDLLGTALPKGQRFPLLIKLIDAQDCLSVQVHPDDDYAAYHEKGSPGKSEMWYVVSASPGARLIAGLKPGVDRRTFADAILSGNCLDLLNEVLVKPGDAINIPAGLVHAVGAGLVLYEIQQNSDITYRVFDYNRRNDQGQLRPLHIEKALDVIDFNRKETHPLIQGLIIRNSQITRRVLVLNRYFFVEELSVHGNGAAFSNDGSRFSALTVISGEGSLSYQNEIGHWISEPLFAGNSLLLPARLGNWTLSGNMKIISGKPSLFEADAAWLSLQITKADLIHSEKDADQRNLFLPKPLAAAAAQGLIALEPYPDEMKCH